MDGIISPALEEICASGPAGIPVSDIWSKLRPSLAAAGLDLCPDIKTAIWSALLSVPSLQFVAPDASSRGGDPVVQSLEEAEGLGLRIVAAGHLRDTFLGIYDVGVTDTGFPPPHRRALELLGAARANGITQSQLAREFGKNGNNMFYIVRNLECQGLVTRHSTVVRTNGVNNEAESRYRSTVSTNMIYLSRYSKNLGPQQRLEIKKSDISLNNPENVDVSDVMTGYGASGKRVEEEVLVKDNLPALKAICDKLEEANGKVLVVSDIKKDLGYRLAAGHRRWRNICKKLKDAGFVEEFLAKVNKKEASCLRLLKSYSPTSFEQRTGGFGEDYLEEQTVKAGYRDKITDQMVELPIEHQAYDMINAEGPAGLTITEVCRRLGINGKKNYKSLLNMFARFGMHLQPEFSNRAKGYRVWTSGNYHPEHSNAIPSTLKNLLNESGVSNVREHSHRPVASTSKGDIVISKEANCNETEVESSHGHPVDVDDIHMLSSSSNSPVVVDEQRALVPHVGLGLMSVATECSHVLSETAPLALSKPQKRQSYESYPCLSLTAANAFREQNILEMLQERKFILRAELHRWLGILEQDSCKVMDRKTLIRILNKLQKLGHCRCVDIAVPVVSNYHHSRVAQVVLHPSIQGLPSELMGEIYDRIKSFDTQSRRESVPKLKNNLSVRALDDIQRIPNDVRPDDQARRAESMRANGFVLAKMVRAKLLHGFLWDYLNSSPDINVAPSSGNNSSYLENSHSTCKPFLLDGAIKAIPLELFLQIVGSSQQFENLIEKCKSGLLLSDLPVQEYKHLMSTLATGRLSWLIDILRRLKLIRVVTVGQSEDTHWFPLAGPKHSMELEPYIEEPVPILASSSNLISLDIRPRKRHDFILSNRKAVDIYWKTLEYCYAAADPVAALHAFPGSAVREVFRKRSWASVRVMTAEQRAELPKRIVNDDPSKKIALPECEKIAKDLNLSLEQVLRFHYEQRQRYQKKLQKGLNTEEELQPQDDPPPALSRKRKRRLGRQLLKLVDVDNEPGQLVAPIATKLPEEKNLNRTPSRELDSDSQSCREDDRLKDMDETGSFEENEGSCSSQKQYAFSTMRRPYQKRFFWSDDADRQLIIQYVRYRAVLGAKFHRVDWSSLMDLPASPDCCRRRMQLLRNNTILRQSVMRLCNVLSERYAKHLNKACQYPIGNRPSAQGMEDKVFSRNFSGVVEHAKGSNCEEEPWDDFDDESLRLAFDEVLRQKKLAKLEASKQIGSVSNKWSGQSAAECNLDRAPLVSSGTPGEDVHNPKSIPSNEKIDVDRHAHESLAVSNAVELFKVIFLGTLAVPEVQNMSIETLRRYSVHDLSTAFNYLKAKKIMDCGDGSGLCLSPQFQQNISYYSPFPTDTGKNAARLASWLQNKEDDMIEDEMLLNVDIDCGVIFHLFALVSFGELSVIPCLPDVGLGEAEDLKNSKRKADNEIYNDDLAKRRKPSVLEGEITSRKAKGFPGIKVLLRQEMISVVNGVEISRDGKNSADENGPLNPMCGQDFGSSASHFEDISEISNHESIIHVTGAPSESLWEAMAGYARYVASIHCDREQANPFFSELFLTVYAAIQRAGDQGLCMEEVSQISQIQGEDISEIIVEVLEAFGRAMKVNAYDSVHVVDTLYRSKYFLSSATSSSQECNSASSMKLPWTNVDNCFIRQSENKLPRELGVNSDDVHRITILNHPEEVVHPFSDIQCSERVDDCMVGEVSRTFHSSSTDSKRCRPILPWINVDGTINDAVYKGLIRSVFGTVMLNPGILEDGIIQRMHTLNPQSCRKLLELMILDNHLIVRKMHQRTSYSPPSILGSLVGSRFNKSWSVSREHFFANPSSTFLL